VDSRSAQTQRATGAKRLGVRAAALPNMDIRSLLLVRNGVEHDARVLRAARVAERALGGRALVVGVATAASPPGQTTAEGIAIVRLPARSPRMEYLAQRIERSLRRRWSAGTRAAGASSTGGRTVVPAPHARLHVGPPRLTPPERARRILSGLSYALQAVALARRSGAELVQANDWNTMWAGLFIKYLTGARLVYDSHELWADRNGRWEWRPWLLACEALFVRLADEVLTSSPGYADALASRYRTARPAVIRNIPERHATIPAGAQAGLSPPCDRASPSHSHHSHLCEQSEAGGIAADGGGRPAVSLIVYIGGLMPGRGLEQMIDALPLIPEVRLRAVGPGASRYRASLLSRAQAAGVADRLELCAPVPPAEVGGALAGAAAGLCLIQPICRSYELCLPNKLFEYTAAGVPVLVSDLPVIATVVRNEGFGEVAPAGDCPHAIATSLRRMLEPDSWALNAGRALAFAASHGWADEARTLEVLYGQVASDSPRDAFIGKHFNGS
jgi:glycosyltransferase involved in cell wall biosynthesis